MHGISGGRVLNRAGSVALVLCALAGVTGASAVAPISTAAVPRAVCGPGAKPETGRQGRLSQADIDSGRAARGFQCNFEVVSHFGERGGYKVERYVDAAGHECAFYDSTLLFPQDAVAAGQNLTGAYVLDMSDPAHPVRTATLSSPAMQSPHESMALNQKRGLLVAVTANPAFAPGFVDVYDVSADCRHPALQSSTPSGVLGHESGFAPDGQTFYSSSLDARVVTAVDVSNPVVTHPAWIEYNQFAQVHGISVNEDGTRAYLATREGLKIIDVTNVQKRVINPSVSLVSSLTWPQQSTPQIAEPVTIKGHPYLVEIDEFGSLANIGAARIIDIGNEKKPEVISNIRLEVNQPAVQAEQASDPGAKTTFRGYAGHYCEVPQRKDPGILACTFILSGLRLFDIHDPYHPREIAYFNPPPRAKVPGVPLDTVDPVSNYAMSKPTFVPARREVWYTDGNNGFYALRVTNGVWGASTGAGNLGNPGGPGALVTATSPGLPSTSRAWVSWNDPAVALAVAALLGLIVPGCAHILRHRPHP